jgi:hypothetical protein
MNKTAYIYMIFYSVSNLESEENHLNFSTIFKEQCLNF